MDEKPLEGEIEKLLSQLKLQQKNPEQKVIIHWEEIVGEKISKKAKPYRLQNKKLYVKTESSHWAFELNIRYKREIINKVNLFLEEKKIEEIHFSVGQF